MSKNQINELALAREMQLMYTYTRGFSPIEGKINRWEGTIEIDTPQGNLTIPVEVLVPLKFPQYPPRIIIKDKEITHPNVEKDGNVLLRILHEWTPDLHVYQAIQALQDLFNKVAPQKGRTSKQKATVSSREVVTTKKEREVEDVNESITRLQDKIKEKDEELRSLQAKLVKGSNEKVAKIEDLEMLLPANREKSEKLLLQAQSAALADLISTLDEKFKDGEISPVDFSKLYRRYTKELYIAHKKLEKL